MNESSGARSERRFQLALAIAAVTVLLLCMLSLLFAFPPANPKQFGSQPTRTPHSQLSTVPALGVTYDATNVDPAGRRDR